MKSRTKRLENQLRTSSTIVSGGSDLLCSQAPSSMVLIRLSINKSGLISLITPKTDFLSETLSQTQEIYTLKRLLIINYILFYFTFRRLHVRNPYEILTKYPVESDSANIADCSGIMWSTLKVPQENVKFLESYESFVVYIMLYSTIPTLRSDSLISEFVCKYTSKLL